MQEKTAYYTLSRTILNVQVWLSRGFLYCNFYSISILSLVVVVSSSKDTTSGLFFNYYQSYQSLNVHARCQ